MSALPTVPLPRCPPCPGPGSPSQTAGRAENRQPFPARHCPAAHRFPSAYSSRRAARHLLWPGQGRRQQGTLGAVVPGGGEWHRPRGFCAGGHHSRSCQGPQHPAPRSAGLRAPQKPVRVSPSSHDLSWALLGAGLLAQVPRRLFQPLTHTCPGLPPARSPSTAANAARTRLSHSAVPSEPARQVHSLGRFSKFSELLPGSRVCFQVLCFQSSFYGVVGHVEPDWGVCWGLASHSFISHHPFRKD